MTYVVRLFNGYFKNRNHVGLKEGATAQMVCDESSGQYIITFVKSNCVISPCNPMPELDREFSVMGRFSLVTVDRQGLQGDIITLCPGFDGKDFMTVFPVKIYLKPDVGTGL